MNSGELVSMIVIVCQRFEGVTVLGNFASLWPHFTRGVDNGVQAARILDGALYVHRWRYAREFLDGEYGRLGRFKNLRNDSLSRGIKR